jgi:hypothetical protein
MTTNQLPDTLSDLLEIAVDDCQEVERDERYVLYMFNWHRPGVRVDGRCMVCMAGAVMVHRLGLPIECAREPEDFGVATATKLRAIDSMRTGDSLTLVADSGGTEAQDKKLFRAMESIRRAYDKQLGRAPWSVYRDAVRALREAGL